MPRSGIPKGKQKRWKSIPFHRRRTWQFASRYNPRFRPRVRLKPWEVPPSGAAVKRERRIVRTREQRIQEERRKEEAKLLEPKPAEETVQAKPQPKQTEQTRPRIITQEQKTIRFYHGEFTSPTAPEPERARPTPLRYGAEERRKERIVVTSPTTTTTTTTGKVGTISSEEWIKRAKTPEERESRRETIKFIAERVEKGEERRQKEKELRQERERQAKDLSWPVWKPCGGGNRYKRQP